jgi:hypothetical protein
LCDRSVVASKPIGLFSKSEPEISDSRSVVNRFESIFDVAWTNSTESDVGASLACFISYSRANADLAVAVKQVLARNHIHAWRDVDDIPAGAIWDLEIERAISGCTHVLFLATQSAVRSGNVVDELAFGRSRDKIIVPLLFEEVELPLRVHRAQGVDFRNDFSEAAEQLVRKLYQSAGLKV